MWRHGAARMGTAGGQPATSTTHGQGNSRSESDTPVKIATLCKLSYLVLARLNSILNNIDQNDAYAKYAKPGGWNG
jgi:hypothetical protein